MVSFKQYFYEQILGNTEGITIQHVGTVRATVDTGNNGHNVLHAADLNEQDGAVSFNTVNNKHLKLPIKEHITVTGNNNTNTRPVVLLDCSIGSMQFNKEPFSLADRSEQDTPVLLCRDFIKKNGGVVNVKINQDIKS
jgi:hypothetical protein